MTKTKILTAVLAIALVTGSSFTKSAFVDQYYETSPGVFELVTTYNQQHPGMHCDVGTTNCKWIKDPSDPSNFIPDPSEGSNPELRFVP